MENKYLIKLKELITNIFKDDKIRIVLFGSRARRDNYPASDVDIGIISSEKIDEKKITILRELIDDLNIPYKIDIINLSEVSLDFKKEALKNAEIWKD